MELFTKSYDMDVYNYIKSVKPKDKKSILYDLDVLGKGIYGIVYSAYLKSNLEFNKQLVVKQVETNQRSNNEIEALKYLRDEMINGTIPNYYVFLYTSFNIDNCKCIVMEKLDINLDDYMTSNNLTTKEYYDIFYNIANSIYYLEKIKFNHGDLWVENIMLNWEPNEKKYRVKLIDFDSSFMENNPLISKPNIGGSKKYRKSFILGYDLNRFFDSIIHSYESYISKKTQNKKSKIARLQKKKNKNRVIPSLDIDDTSDEEYDIENVIYPKEIIDFFYTLNINSVDDFNDNIDMSAINIQKALDSSFNFI